MEKELRKAFEEVTTNNVKAILEHGNATRKIAIELKHKVELLEQTITDQNETINNLRIQLSNIQAIVFRGGTSGI
jgi:hypothetical protein